MPENMKNHPKKATFGHPSCEGSALKTCLLKSCFLRLQSSENKTSIPTKQQGRCQAGVFPVHPGFYPVEPPQSDFRGSL